MPQSGQSGAIKAPESRAALDGLIAQRNELQGQLRALEDRRFQLAEQRKHIDGAVAADQDRRIKTLDASIDRIEREIATANEHIAAGHARFGGQQGLLAGPSPADIAQPAPPPPPPPVAYTEVAPSPPVDVGFIVGRALLIEGVGFLLLGAVAWVWAIRRLERKLGGRAAGDPGQMTHLQQSVDAIALEVERISENQRWVTKQINERALGGGEARPVEVDKAAAERIRRER